MKGLERRHIRCAIYTRKSTDEGLEQEFNSLDAQYDACRAFIQSQTHEGWVAKPERYDDGGFSGGTLLRPALTRLLSDVDNRLIDMVVLYKVDRLTRSLSDFGKLVERFDQADCSFASVTQSFNTSTSTGRLMLNVLLSFAQFEREVTTERIRDKISASKKKGVWMGGTLPLGYFAKDRKLVVDKLEAEKVRTLFAFFKQSGCLTETWRLAERFGIRSRPSTKYPDGPSFRRSGIRWILQNPVYVGRIRHGDVTHQGHHEPIIGMEAWNEVQALVRRYDVDGQRRRPRHGEQRSLLAGRVFDETMTPLVPRSGRRRGHYYVSKSPAGSDLAVVAPWRIRGELLEALVREAVRKHLQTSEGIRRAKSLSEERRKASPPVATNGAAQLTDLEPLELVKHVRLQPGILRTFLDAKKLASYCRIDLKLISDQLTQVSAPFQLHRSRNERRLLVGDCQNVVDQGLLRFVSQGFVWWKEILEGNSVVNIARANNVSIRQVTIHLPCAFLAPDIVESIVDGRQPPRLTITALRESDLPTDWVEQRRLFGVA